MPQMSPLNWTWLYIFISCIFILFSIINFYNFMYPTKNNLYISTSKILTWKW
uniref:ATP synthase F0 subunit 8 n=1 Tax=Curculionidae sp. 3 AH-2016 TaxID=1903829 RepID=A0A343C2P6_9CUCU|nr:ATP synthase F0 subunit 8 [Curculionidae sp. 3 AH-2016]